MIGTGYVGLVSGACFADFGHQVTCVDKDGDKIASLRRGEIPIFEPGLDALVAANVKAKRLDFTTDLSAPVAEADAVFIAVGTPSRRGDGHADLTYVYAAAREIAASISGFTVVVSSLPNEGKTIVAANLAALMTSSSGARTLIIDSDLHLRKLTAGLAPGAREGLLEALENPHRLGAIVSRRHSGLDVLACPSSDRIPNAAELLGSPEMEKLLAVARKSYDYIIIEIAPIMSVVDVKTIERFIDRFVFVVEWGQTKKSLVVDALSSVEMIRDRIVGIVLNKADPVALRSIESYKGDRSEDYYRD